MFNLSSNNETSRRWKLFRYTVNNRIHEASVQLKSDFTEFPWSTIILNEYIFIILFIRMRITGENRGEQGRTGENRGVMTHYLWTKIIESYLEISHRKGYKRATAILYFWNDLQIDASIVILVMILKSVEPVVGFSCVWSFIWHVKKQSSICKYHAEFSAQPNCGLVIQFLYNS